jgi:hypothetical protein
MGLLGGRKKQQDPSADQEDENSEGGSEEMFKTPTKKRSILGRLRPPASTKKEEHPLEDDGENDAMGSVNSNESGGGSKMDEDEDKTESEPPKVCETIPDCETEFHVAIQNHNWDELEHLLKEYDFKKYIRPKPKPQKKQTKKLRVAKYLPELPELRWRREKEVPISPLYGLDDLGRTPLHLCCVNPVPNKLVLKLLFVARDAASVPDATESLPIHLAVTHERNVEVVDKLIRGYYEGSWLPDGSGRTPLMWAVEVARRLQQEDKVPASGAFWAFPSRPMDIEWQQAQEKIWEMVQFLLENREARRKKLLPREYRQIVQVLGLAAPPNVISLMLTMGKEAFKKEELAGPAMSLCISRQYPLELVETLIEDCPTEFPKLYKDSTGRGIVAAHYRIGSVLHHDTGNKRYSFRMTMQHLANANHELHEEVVPPAPYLDWWEKLKFLINLWGSHIMDDSSNDSFNDEELLLHSALSNPDVPPSLIQLLAALHPNSTDLEHPKSNALPLHLACRVWRYRHFPPRRGEKEMKMDVVVLQLMEGDYTRTRKRYRDRLPLHHAIAAGKNWLFMKPLVAHDRKSLHVRDPTTKIYPFQLAAGRSEVNFDMATLTRHQFTPAEWAKLRDYEQEHEIRKVEHYYDLEQLTVIFELLKHSPEAINHETLANEEAARRAAGPKRRIVVVGAEASEEVATSTQMKMVRAMFGLGSVSGHFIAWCYENTRRGWKTHRSHFAVVKEAIMDGFVPSAMDKWWRTLKFWIWQDCPWDKVPHRDEFLLHGALCNRDTSPWIIDLLLECFPRSASIPLPQSDGCYPLHIACVTDRYASLPWEFPNKRTAIEMAAKAFPDACLLKWRNKLPLHLAISHSKDWDEIKFLAQEEPVALAVPDPKTNFFPFQFMALNRPYTLKQRNRFETIAIKEVGKEEWRAASAHEKVVQLSKVLEQHEIGILGCIWELLKRNPVLVSVGLIASGDVASIKMSSISVGDGFFVDIKSDNASGSDFLNSLEANLSLASLDFLEEVYEKDGSMQDVPPVEAKTASESDGSLSDPFLDRSFEVPPQQERLYAVGEIDERGSRPREESDNTEGLVPIPRSQVGHNDDFYETMSQEISPVEYDYEEIDPTFVLAEASDPHDNFATLNFVDAADVKNEESTMEDTVIIPVYSAVQLKARENSPFDHQELCSPRRKDIILVSEGSAFVIWKSEILAPGSLKRSSNKKYWLKVLRNLGEQVDVGDLHILRHETEQESIASVVVDGSTIFIDEDDGYIWILCGTDAACTVENYDVQAAMVVTSSLVDSETGVWLSAFQEAQGRDSLSGKNDPHRILDWILSTVENGGDGKYLAECQRFMITRLMLRKAFGYGTLNVSPAIAELIIEKSTRELTFDVSKQKLEARLKKRRRVNVRFQIAKAPRFESYRAKFAENQLKVKLFKKLRKKQRRFLKRMSMEAGEDTRRPSRMNGGSTHAIDESAEVVMQPPTHLLNIHQPRPELDDEDGSLVETDLFDPPKGPPHEKPLLAAALKAKQQAEQSRDVEDAASTIIERKKKLRQESAGHLMSMNQPKTIDENDDKSLGSTHLFDPPAGPPPKKPLLAAALKAKQQSEQSKCVELEDKNQSAEHLMKMNQPNTAYEDDNKSLGSNDLFDPPRGLPPEKPLLAAALKAKQQNEQAQSLPQRPREAKTRNTQKPRRKSTEHLMNMNQPVTVYDDGDCSIGFPDLFDPSKERPPTKPLLAAALKAKQQAERSRSLQPNSAGERAATVEREKRRTMIEKELEIILAETEAELEEALEPEALSALKMAAEKVAYTKKYYDNLKETFIYLPSVAKTIIDDSLIEEAKENYFNGEEEFPTEYTGGLRYIAAQVLEGCDLDYDHMEKFAVSFPLEPAAEHLEKTHPPKAEDGDGHHSIGSIDLFELPKGSPPENPQLTTALKARQQAQNSQTNQTRPKVIESEQSQTLSLQFENDGDKTYTKSSRWSMEHLRTLNQPKTIDEADDDSLGSADLFEPPKGPPAKKPLLAAALKAKQQAEHSRGSGAEDTATDEPAAHLINMHQPKAIDEDDDASLGSADLFEPPKGPPAKKPLLAAALKAKEQAEQTRGSGAEDTATEEPAAHLINMHQPKAMDEDVDASLGSADLFEPPKGPPAKKPLLAAALKAKEQAEQTRGSGAEDRATEEPAAHLMNMHQPKAIDEDDNASLGSADLVEPPKGPPAKKPLLAAALKAKEQAEQTRGSGSKDTATDEPASHLINMHQPKAMDEDDNASLGSADVFEPREGPPAKKPLLAAALKAKEQAEQTQRSGAENRATEEPAIHSINMHQPKTIEENDNASLGSADLFEPPKGPPAKKPLLAAALKAKEQAEQTRGSGAEDTATDEPAVHLINMHQPKAMDEDDDPSLGSADLFEPPKGPPAKKPLLAAALKAKEQAEQTRGSGAEDTATEEPAIHSMNMHQPKAIDEDDNASLGSADLFEPPKGPPAKKPLLAAALKAKEQAEQTRGSGAENRATEEPAVHLINMHQPKTMDEDDNASLGSADVLEPHKGPPAKKPLLAAALKAKEQAEQTRGSGSKDTATDEPAAHLINMHQPKSIDEDDNASLGSADLFEAPKGPPGKKPLLAAALKAKQQGEQTRGFVAKDTTTEESVAHLYQLKSIHEDVDVSLGSADVFVSPKGPQAKKPLPGAALKTKQQAEHSRGSGAGDRATEEPASHLINMHQPKAIVKDVDASLGSADVFEPFKGPLAKKPLLAAALKTKQQTEQTRGSGSKDTATEESVAHLINMYQPKKSHEDVDASVGSVDVFEPPKGPPLKKPLLAAAFKAKEQAEYPGASRAKDTTTGEPAVHSIKMHKPKKMQDDADSSLGSTDLFDPSRRSSPEKPLLTAALKAKQQAEQSQSSSMQARSVKHGTKNTANEQSEAHSTNMNQPKTKYEDGNKKTSPEGASDGRGIAYPQKPNAPVPEHLERLCQPGPHEEDDVSIAFNEIFDPPKPPPPRKPLLAAALKAKETMQQGTSGSVGLSKAPPRRGSIIKKSHIGAAAGNDGKSGSADPNMEVSLTMSGVFVARVKVPELPRKGQSRQKVGTEGLSVTQRPMTAHMVRKNSLDRLAKRGGNYVPSMVEAYETKSKKPRRSGKKNDGSASPEKKSQKSQESKKKPVKDSKPSKGLLSRIVGKH